MDHLMYSHYFSLPTQGNIYTITNLELANGTSKLLVASLKREIFCFEYVEGTNGTLIPTAREVSFTYIPTGAEIISIDAYNKSSKNNEFVVGITIIKNSNDSDSLETYLNIYSGWEASEDFNIENIAQNCQSLELNFIPYRLMHADLFQWDNDGLSSQEKVFLLSGSDHYIHVFREGSDHLFKEVDAKEYFPEFIKHPSPVVWMDLMYINNESERLVAIACECGYLRLVKVSAKTKKIIYNFSARLDNYLSNVRLYKDGDGINMVVINTVLSPIIFNNVLKYGLSNYCSLPRHNPTNILTCCEITDIDLDGKLEILVGTSAKTNSKLDEARVTYVNMGILQRFKNNSEIVLYKRDDEGRWILEEIKKISSPVIGLKHLDIAGDAVRQMIVFSMKGVHIYQLDPDFVQSIIDEKLEKISIADLEKVGYII